eukprot:364964-Chlamydomonas_euryale.AAC.17
MGNGKDGSSPSLPRFPCRPVPHPSLPSSLLPIPSCSLSLPAPHPSLPPIPSCSPSLPAPHPSLLPIPSCSPSLPAPHPFLLPSFFSYRNCHQKTCIDELVPDFDSPSAAAASTCKTNPKRDSAGHHLQRCRCRLLTLQAPRRACRRHASPPCRPLGVPHWEGAGLAVRVPRDIREPRGRCPRVSTPSRTSAPPRAVDVHPPPTCHLPPSCVDVENSPALHADRLACVAC